MENNFENEWQKAFDDAYIFPPVKVWNNIESQLPPSQANRKWWLWIFVFLGGVSLSGLGGYWFATSKTKQAKSSEILLPSKAHKLVKPVVAAPSQVSTALKTPNSLPNNPNKILVKPISQKSLNLVELSSNKTKNNNQQYTNNQLFTTNSKIEISYLNTAKNQVIPPDKSQEILTNIPKIVYSTVQNFERLNNKLIKAIPVHLPMPEVAYATSIIKKAKTDNNPKAWFGLSLNIARFNPNMQFDAQSLNVYSNLANDNPNKVSDTGLAYQFEIKAGKTIAKYWIIESGIRYTKANGTLLSNAYWIDRLTSTKASFVSALLSPSLAGGNNVFDKLGNVASTNVLLPSTKPVDQAASWAFVSIPTKLGYQIKTNNKLTWIVLAGISVDFFLKNEIANTTTLPAKTFTRADQVYNPLNMSGLIGLRANYQINQKAFLSFDAGYQKALNSGLPAGTSIQFKPSSLGINAGINWQLGKK